MPIKSGVPQVSVLGPILFLLYINDITDIFPGPTTVIKLYADDAKLYSSIKGINDYISLQAGLELITDWSRMWQLSIADHKCSILHLGKGDPSFLYSIGTSRLPMCSHIRDHGVEVDSTLSFNLHINNNVSKANQRAYIIRKCFLSKDVYCLTKAFTVYARHILEYCSSVWYPFLIGDISRIEAVQLNFTNRLPGLSKLSHAERLRRLGLETFEIRRLRADVALLLNYKRFYCSKTEISSLFLITLPVVTF